MEIPVGPDINVGLTPVVFAPSETEPAALTWFASSEETQSAMECVCPMNNIVGGPTGIYPNQTLGYSPSEKLKHACQNKDHRHVILTLG